MLLIRKSTVTVDIKFLLHKQSVSNPKCASNQGMLMLAILTVFMEMYRNGIKRIDPQLV